MLDILNAFNFYAGFFALIFLAIFALLRLRFLLMFFQQEEYENKNFLKLVFKGARFVDKRLSLTLLLLWAVALALPCLVFFVFVPFVFCALREQKYMRRAKKKLVMTWRAKRIFFVAFVLTLGVIFGLYKWAIFSPLMIAIITVQLLPFMLVLANIILIPVEAYGRRKFVRMASAKIAKSNATVIGVTGSYGKTSVKHFLAHILAANAEVLFTPGSVNTLLGVSRIINQNLNPSHKFFIVEMGAYYIGSIKKVCDLVRPKHGIITAVGDAHFERFKTKENVAKAKFELANAVGENGVLVINKNQIEERFFGLLPKGAIKVGEKEKFFVSDVKQSEKGLQFVFHNGKRKMKIFAPIFGKHHAQNIALAIAMALELGMPQATIIAALKNLPQVAHRLEVKNAGGAVIIDDGYNSNPDGFASALELLGILGRGKKGRRILISPGMIEMGGLHDKLHYDLGEKAGEVADILIAVVPSRLKSFTNGFRKTAGKNALVVEAEGFADAKVWMSENLLSGDVVLIENDLPDSYESGFKL